MTDAGILRIQIEKCSVIDGRVAAISQVVDDCFDNVHHVVDAVLSTARNHEVEILRQVVHCVDCLASNYVLVSVEQVSSVDIAIGLRIRVVVTLSVNSNRGISVCCTSCPSCYIVVILDLSRNTQFVCSSTEGQQSVVDSVQNQFLDVVESVKHRTDFIFDVDNLIVVIKILINHILGSRVTTSDQVSDDSRQDVILDVTLTSDVTTRNFKEVILGQIASNFVLQFC